MSFPRYPSYKDSGVEWLGEVPEGWEAGRFSRAISGIKDGTHGTFERITVGRPLLSAKNVQDGYLLVTDDESLISEPDHLSIISNGFPQKGDLLLTIVGTIGRSCVYDFENSIAFQRSVCFIRLIPGNETRFFYYFTQSKFFQEQLISRSKSAAQGGVYMGDVVATTITYPPLPEQTQIATFLDRETSKINRLVAEQQRLMELLKEKRQSVIFHAVTQGLNPRAPKKPSGVEWLGDVPEHWGVVPFSFAINFQEGPGILAVDFHEEGIPLLRVSGVQGRWATLDGCNYLDPEKVAIRWNHFRLELGDLVISASASMGTVCEVGPEAEGAVPYTGLIRLTARNNAMTRDYIRAILGSVLFHTQIDLLKAGTTIQHFGPTHLQQMKVLLPSLDEQDEIASFVATETAKFDTLTAEAQRAIDLLQERRTALISAAVTGQIDVRQLAEMEPA